MILTTEQSLPHLKQPQEHKTRISVWADLTVEDVDKLNESLNADQNRKDLAEILNLKNYKDDIKEAIVVDLFYNTIQFARENNFNKEKTSTIFSIVKRVHEVCVETSYDNLAETFKYFKGLLLCHAVKRPPHSIDLFNADEVRIISEHVINTYFRHFKMYKYVFTPLVLLDLRMNYVGIPEPPEEPEVEGEPEVRDDGAEEGQTDEPAAVNEGESPVDEADNKEKEIVEESQAHKELRKLIQSALSEELKKMKVSFDEQIKSTETSIQSKIDAADNTGKKKSPRHSAKGKKK